MATTTNYSWATPDDTDLVKDGAAAIRTLGSSADTTVKNLNPGTTAGDIDYYTSGTAKARIGIGTAGQILVVNSGATAPEWATPAPAASLTLLSTTSLSGVSTTISSISGAYKNLLIIGRDIDAAANANVNLRFNGDSGNNYDNVGYATQGGANGLVTGQGVAYVPGVDFRVGGDPSNFILEIFDYTETSRIQGYMAWLGLSTTAQKFQGRSDFRYSAAAAITSFTVTNSNSQSMTGTIEIYGVN